MKKKKLRKIVTALSAKLQALEDKTLEMAFSDVADKRRVRVPGFRARFFPIGKVGIGTSVKRAFNGGVCACDAADPCVIGRVVELHDNFIDVFIENPMMFP